MSRYIDADELLKEASKDGAYGYVSAEQIADFPTADVAEVRHGRWDDSKVAFHRVCSGCGAVVRQDVSLVYLLECMEKVGVLNYCPNCGASMGEVEAKQANPCDTCWIAQNYNLEDDDSPCQNCGEDEDASETL